MGKLSAVVLTAATIALTFTGAAHAETNPYCSSVTQIGATKYIKSGSETVASVKQFKGCNQNWGYIYVWDSWKAKHGSRFKAAAGIMTRSSGEPLGYGGAPEGVQEAWSTGSNTLSVCTRAYGSVITRTGGTYDGETEERC
jgi:hypothetical protein